MNRHGGLGMRCQIVRSLNTACDDCLVLSDSLNNGGQVSEGRINLVPQLPTTVVARQV